MDREVNYGFSGGEIKRSEMMQLLAQKPELTLLDEPESGIDLSHEAAVGKIAEEEVEYLMTRGLTRTEATAVIVRGFLNVDIEGLPPMLSAELRRAVEASEKDLM